MIYGHWLSIRYLKGVIKKAILRAFMTFLEFMGVRLFNTEKNSYVMAKNDFLNNNTERV